MSDEPDPPRGRLLCVEADAFTRRSLQQALRPVAEVTATRDGMQAMSEIAIRGPFQVVTVDLDPRGLCDADLLAALLARSPNTVPTAISSCGTFPKLVALLNRGLVWRYVSKPFTAAALLDHVSAAFDEHDRRTYGAPPPPEAQAEPVAAPVVPAPLADNVSRIGQIADALRNLSLNQLRLPAVDPLALEIPDLLRRPALSVDEVVALVSRDPVLASEILNLARTARFHTGGQLTTIAAACLRLGTRRVCNLAEEVLLKRAFGAGSGQIAPLVRAYWEAAVEVADASRKLAGMLHDSAPDEVYLAALLVDIGELIILHLVSKTVDGALTGKELAELGQFVRARHEDAGSLALRSWGAASEIVQIASAHHREPALALSASVARRRSIIVTAHALRTLAKAPGRLDPGVDPRGLLDQLGMEMSVEDVTLHLDLC